MPAQNGGQYLCVECGIKRLGAHAGQQWIIGHVGRGKHQHAPELALIVEEEAGPVVEVEDDPGRRGGPRTAITGTEEELAGHAEVDEDANSRVEVDPEDLATPPHARHRAPHDDIGCESPPSQTLVPPRVRRGHPSSGQRVTQLAPDGLDLGKFGHVFTLLSMAAVVGPKRWRRPGVVRRERPGRGRSGPSDGR